LSSLYHPPPSSPPPVAAHAVLTDGKAISALVFGILGLVFGIPLGLPGLIAGPIAYFLGKGAKQRIAESNGSLGGAGAANAGRILGIVATAAGAVVTLVYLIVLFNALLDVGSQTGF
jgi:hypothetical protein